jgi:hypothetical protein
MTTCLFPPEFVKCLTSELRITEVNKTLICKYIDLIPRDDYKETQHLHNKHKKEKFFSGKLTKTFIV